MSEQPLGPDAEPLGAQAVGLSVNQDLAALAPEEDAREPTPFEGRPLAAVPPSLLEAIDADTPPHVAAATRLSEEGRARMVAGDHDGALDKLERAIALDPMNAYAYYFLAEVHLHRGAYDQAIAFAGKAAALSARAGPSWLSRAHDLQGRVFEAAGRFADARAAYRRALEADGGNRAAQAGLARLGGWGGP